MEYNKVARKQRGDMRQSVAGTHPEAGLQALPPLGAVPHLAGAGALHAVRALQQALQEVGAAGAAAVLHLCA
jgi:predicted TIM-barrel enzyme